MKTKRWLAIGWLALAAPIMAQNKVEVDFGADLVSGYVWRGQDLGNVSIQPELSVGYKGLSLSAWGSVGFSKNDTKELPSKEFDLTLGYGIKGFSVSVTDYWFNNGPGYFHYKAGHTSHVFEAQVGYDFGFLAVNWHTNFAGNDGTDKDGNRAYASYFNLAAPFNWAGLDWAVSIGATPWANTFYNGGADGFEITDVCLEVSKKIRITEYYSFPVFAHVIWNPATEGAYFVVGVGF